MIEITVDIQDFTDDYNMITLKLPTNIDLKLDKSHEYVIIDCTPYIKLPNHDDIFKLNATLKYINDNNSAMSAEFLSMLLDISPEKDLFNQTFLNRLVNDDFYFKEINEVPKNKSHEISVAKYLLLNQHIQPHTALPKNPSTDIEWSFVWSAYSNMGFRIINGNLYDYEGLFVAYW